MRCCPISELNPIEMIWDEIREKGFRNEIFVSLEKVIDRLCDCVRSLMSNAVALPLSHTELGSPGIHVLQ